MPESTVNDAEYNVAFTRLLSFSNGIQQPSSVYLELFEAGIDLFSPFRSRFYHHAQIFSFDKCPNQYMFFLEGNLLYDVSERTKVVEYGLVQIFLILKDADSFGSTPQIHR